VTNPASGGLSGSRQHPTHVSQLRLQGGELVHGGEELIDLPLLHGLAQQALDCFRAASEAELPSWAA